MLYRRFNYVAALLPCVLLPQRQLELSEKSVHNLYVRPIGHLVLRIYQEGETSTNDVASVFSYVLVRR